MTSLLNSPEELSDAIASGVPAAVLYFGADNRKSADAVIAFDKTAEKHASCGVSFLKFPIVAEVIPGLPGGTDLPAVVFFKKGMAVFLETEHLTEHHLCHKVKSFAALDLSVEIGRKACYLVGGQGKLKIKVNNLSNGDIILSHISANFQFENHPHPCKAFLDEGADVISAGDTQEYEIWVSTPLQHHGDVAFRLDLSYSAGNEIKQFKGKQVAFWIWTTDEWTQLLKDLSAAKHQKEEFWDRFDEFIETQILGLAKRENLTKDHFIKTFYYELLSCDLAAVVQKKPVPEPTVKPPQEEPVTTRSNIEGNPAVFRIGRCDHHDWARCRTTNSFCGSGQEECGNHMILLDSKDMKAAKASGNRWASISRRAADLLIYKDRVCVLNRKNTCLNSKTEVLPHREMPVNNGDYLYFKTENCKSSMWLCRIDKSGDEIATVTLEWKSGIASRADGNENTGKVFVIKRH